MGKVFNVAGPCMTAVAAVLLAGSAVANSADGVRVSERFGYDPVDSTRFVQAALDSKLPKIVLDRREGPWVVTQLKGRSNQTVVFESGAELVAKRGAFKGLYDSLLTYGSASNVTLVGYGATVRMWKEDYTNATKYASSEWRHALALSSCRDFTVKGLSIVASGGDGIYVGEMWTNGPNRRVTIRDVRCLDNTRQGVSVISADGLLIENTVMSGTCGRPPAAGIDFEPNNRRQCLVGIVLRNCTLEDNAGGGFDFATWLLDNSSRPLDILIENCRSANNGTGKTTGRVQLAPAASPFRDVRGRVTFRSCELLDGWQTPDALRNLKKTPTAFVLSVENCTVRDPSAPGGTVVMNESWPVLPWTADPAAADIPAVPADLPADATVVDACPGTSVPVRAPFFRFGATLRIYAARPGPVTLKVRQRGVSRRKDPTSRAQVFFGADVTSKPVEALAVTGFEPTDWTFMAARKGFYTLRFTSLPESLGVVATDAPVAVVGGGPLGDYAPYFVLEEGDLFFEVPSGTDRFLAVVAGGGGNERVRASVADPHGARTFGPEEVGEFHAWTSSPSPAPGLWRLMFRKPTKGILEDYMVDLRGVPLCFFLSPEKRWR